MKQNNKRANEKKDSADNPDSSPHGGVRAKSQTNQNASAQTDKERQGNEESPEFFWINRWSRGLSMWERIKCAVQRPDWWMVIGTWVLSFFAAWTLFEIHSASVLDQRAWVGVIKVNQFDFKIGPNFSVPFDMTNSGKTPALHVHSETSLKSLEKTAPFSPTYDDPPFDQAKYLCCATSNAHRPLDVADRYIG